MKTIRSILFVIVGVALLPSCGKYEEGPGLSFRSKKARISNVWIVDYAYSIADAVEITGDFAGDRFEFTKEGDYKENGIKEGTWALDDEKELIVITYLDASTDQYQIIQLKENSMILEEPGEERIELIPF